MRADWLMSRLAASVGVGAVGLWGVGVVGGCGVNPTYEVRVMNDSRAAINARIEHDRKFESTVVLESVRVRPGEERVMGPVETAPMERVVLRVGSGSDMMSSPEMFVIKRGRYVARVTDGTSSTWSRYEVDVVKE